MQLIVSLLIRIIRLLEQLIASVNDIKATQSNFPKNDLRVEPDVQFEVAKGKIYLVVMMIWLMVDMGWITVKDSKTKKRINVEQVSQWFYIKLFGKPIKKWDQVLEYIFRWRDKENKEKFLKVFETMKNLVERRIKKD